jgi:FkbM family methyltransferase
MWRCDSRAAAVGLLLTLVPTVTAFVPTHGSNKLCAMEDGTVAGFVVAERLQLPVDDFKYGGGSGREWFQNNWEPHIPCVAEERLGAHGDGGKWVCDPACMLRRNNCLVLSFGSNNQFDFETAIVTKGCVVHTFDHTVSPPAVPAGVVFHKFGVATSTTETAELKSLSTLLREAKLTDKMIDILKMDVEGAEFAFLADPETQAILKTHVRQFLVEFHWQGPEKQVKACQTLTDAGFRVYHKEPNTLGCGGDCIEYALVNVNLLNRH